MNFEFLENGRLAIDMIDYIKECLEVYGKDKVKYQSTPAAHDLFELNEGSERLDKQRSEIFHHIVAKLLFVSKRARLDIEPTISFMCTRVSKSMEQDWSKLGRLLGYLSRTIEMRRVVGANNLSILHSWADASCAVHNDMRGHAGGVRSLGYGVIHNKKTRIINYVLMCSVEKK